MSKYRVLQVIDRLNLAGAQRMMVHLIRTLDRGRFDVAAAVMFDPLGTELEQWLADGGYPVSYLGKRLGFDPRMFFRISRVIRKFRPHVVHTHVGALRYVFPPARFRRVPVVLHTLHNPAEKEVVGFEWVHRIAFRHGVIPVAIADEIKASIGRVYGIEQCPNIPNGIPVETYQNPRMPRKEWRRQEGFSGDDVLFVTIGRLMEQKNHPLLLRCFARVSAVNPRARLLLVGEGPLSAAARELAAGLRLDERVRFLGLRTDIPDILAASDVFVLSSDWEGNPLVVMEAMAAGRPVVSTAVGGIPELVEDGESGLLVPPGRQAPLADAMISLLGDPEAAQALGRRAAQRALDRFDVRVMTRAYEKLYEKELAKARGTLPRSNTREVRPSAHETSGRPR